MWDKKPTTILTDQDPAMAKALKLRWRDTNHRLCIWHIFQNAAEHLSSVFSEFRDFSKDFSSCIYDFEEEEDFLNAWNEMLTKYAAESEDTYNIAKEGVFKMLTEIDGKLEDNKTKGQHSKGKPPVEDIGQPSHVNEVEIGGGVDNIVKVKGIKRKEKPVSGKRYMGGLEEAIKKRGIHPKKVKRRQKTSVLPQCCHNFMRGRMEQIQASSVPFRILGQETSQALFTNYTGQFTNSAGNLHMFHSRQPYYFPQNNYQSGSSNFSERSFIGSTPNLMSMRDSNSVVFGNFNEQQSSAFNSQVSNSQQSSTFNSQISSSQQSSEFNPLINTHAVIQMCRCPFPCPGGMLCRSRK
ncbi:hypothetical protein OROGR_023395 [Orobanche gracilis]